MYNNIILAINKTNLIHALNITWKGMLAIFLVMGLIYLVIVLLNKVTTIPKAKFLAIFKRKGGKKGEDK